MIRSTLHDSKPPHFPLKYHTFMSVCFEKNQCLSNCKKKYPSSEHLRVTIAKCWGPFVCTYLIPYISITIELFNFEYVNLLAYCSTGDHIFEFCLFSQEAGRVYQICDIKVLVCLSAKISLQCKFPVLW